MKLHDFSLSDGDFERQYDARMKQIRRRIDRGDFRDCLHATDIRFCCYYASVKCKMTCNYAKERETKEKAESHLIQMSDEAKGRSFPRGWRA